MSFAEKPSNLFLNFTIGVTTQSPNDNCIPVFLFEPQPTPTQTQTSPTPDAINGENPQCKTMAALKFAPQLLIQLLLNILGWPTDDQWIYKVQQNHR